MKVAVVVPTIKGREEHLERCVHAYRDTAPGCKVFIEYDHPSCGAGWIEGARRAVAWGCDHLHLTADDLEPHDGWLEPAVEAVEKGCIPAPYVYQPDGGLESAGLAGFSLNLSTLDDWAPIEGTTVPFLSLEMWLKIGMIPTHYCTDLWVSTIGSRHGWETIIRSGMRFTHYTAPQGRNYSRAPDDTREYLRLVQEATT